MNVRFLTTLALLVAACASPRTAPGDYLSFEEGAAATWTTTSGDAQTTVVYTVEGGDVRDGVPYRFVYGRPTALDQRAAKSIYGLPETGPQERFLDAWLWRMEHVPPLPLLPRRVVPGAKWTWQGRVTAPGYAHETTATLRVTARVQGVVKVEATYATGDFRVDRWFVENIGLARVEIRRGGKVRETLARSSR